MCVCVIFFQGSGHAQRYDKQTDKYRLHSEGEASQRFVLQARDE